MAEAADGATGARRRQLTLHVPNAFPRSTSPRSSPQSTPVNSRPGTPTLGVSPSVRSAPPDLAVSIPEGRPQSNSRTAQSPLTSNGIDAAPWWTHARAKLTNFACPKDASASTARDFMGGCDLLAACTSADSSSNVSAFRSARERTFFTWLRLSTLLSILSGALYLKLRLVSLPMGGGESLRSPAYWRRRKARRLARKAAKKLTAQHHIMPASAVGGRERQSAVQLPKQPAILLPDGSPSHLTGRDSVSSMDPDSSLKRSQHIFSLPAFQPSLQLPYPNQALSDQPRSPALLNTPAASFALGTLFMVLALASLVTGLVDYLRCEKLLEDEGRAHVESGG